MVKKTKSFTTACLLILILTTISCQLFQSNSTVVTPDIQSNVVVVTSVPGDIEPDAAKLVPVMNLNQDIGLKIVVNDPNKPLKIGFPLDFEYENYAKDQIILPIDFGIRIFADAGTEWREIKNKAIYLSNGVHEVVWGPAGTSASFGNISMWPDIKNKGKPIDILVFVIGKKAVPTGQEDVGAYIKVRLNP